MTIGVPAADDSLLAEPEAAAVAPAATFPDAQPWPNPVAAWWCVTMLSIVLMLSQIDRNVITLLVAPIKRDLHLSDVQMSLLLGPAFILFYVFLGLPLSRVTDTRSRRVIIAIGLSFWTVMTAACGLARSFFQLFAFRVGIGAGEAVNGPATYSMLADYFPRERLPRALAGLNIGFVVGTGMSLFAGGVVVGLLARAPTAHVPILGVIRSWQLVFLVVGLPGLVFAALMLTVPEPVRRGLLPGQLRPEAPPVREVVGFVAERRAIYGYMIGGILLASLLTFGVQNWSPTFYQRTYGWSPRQSGEVLGLLGVFVYPWGLLLSTFFTERLSRKHDDANMRVVIWANALAIPFGVLGPLMPNGWLAAACTGAVGVSVMTAATPFVAALQSVTPNTMRAQISALYLFVLSGLGGGLGPLLIATVTDLLLPSENQIRYAIAGVSLALGVPAVLLISRSRIPYGRAIAAIKAAEAAATT